jgi:mannosyltransferase
MPELDGGATRDVLVGQWFGSSVSLAIVAGVLLALGVRTAWLVVPALGVPTLGLLAAGLSNPELYQSRYLGMVTPFVALGMAAGVAAIPWRPVGVLVVALVVGLAIPQLAVERAVDAKKDTSWGRAAAEISQQRAGSTEVSGVVFGELAPHTAATARVIAIAYPVGFEGLRDVTVEKSGAELGELWSTYSPLDPTSGRLFGLDSVFILGTDTAADEALLLGAGFDLESTWVDDGVRVVKLSR